MKAGHVNKRSGGDVNPDFQSIVEEKILKINGETIIHKYIKGRFLGKVFIRIIGVGWVCTLF